MPHHNECLSTYSTLTATRMLVNMFDLDPEGRMLKCELVHGSEHLYEVSSKSDERQTGRTMAIKARYIRMDADILTYRHG